MVLCLDLFCFQFVGKHVTASAYGDGVCTLCAPRKEMCELKIRRYRNVVYFSR